MTTTDILIQHLERALAQLAQDNARTLAAEVAGVVAEAQAGDMRASMIVWRGDATPRKILALVPEDDQARANFIAWVPASLHDLPDRLLARPFQRIDQIELPSGARVCVLSDPE